MRAAARLRLGALALCLGGAAACSETAESTPDSIVDADAQPVDMALDGEPDGDATVAPDAGVEGQACEVDADCVGVCLGAQAGGRCATPCEVDEDCGDERVCGSLGGRQVCQALQPRVPLGMACDGPGATCEPPGVCFADPLDGALCRAPCAGDDDCEGGQRCAAESGLCLPVDADPFTCATLGCLDGGLRCVRLAPDGPARCLSPCFDADAPCPDGAACLAAAGAEGRVCAPQPGEAGEPCAAAGGCVDGLTCLERAPGDPLARCAAACAADACEAGFVCRRPTGFAARWCLAAPFGVGDQAGDAGADCSTHGPTDCRPALDCVPGPAGLRVCAAPCGEDACEAGLVCAPRRVDGPHCLPGGGVFGGVCEADEGCDLGACLEADDPDARFCSQACPPECPANAACERGWCRPLPPAPQVPPGALCGPEVECASGACATDPADGLARCAEPCGAEGGCAEDFACREVAGQPLCFPGL